MTPRLAWLTRYNSSSVARSTDADVEDGNGLSNKPITKCAMVKRCIVLIISTAGLLLLVASKIMQGIDARNGHWPMQQPQAPGYQALRRRE